jgi:hypothetical protein
MGRGRNLLASPTRTGFDNRLGGGLMVWETLKHLY